MSLSRRTWLALGYAFGLTACGDHYEGGGRRQELPQSSDTQAPNIGPGDGSSTNGGTSTDADTDAAGARSTQGAAAGAP